MNNSERTTLNVDRITEPGVYLRVLPENYFADPCPKPSLTQSIAKILIEQSPAHARLEHPRLNKPVGEPEKYMPDLVIGNAAHALMVGRSRDVLIADFPDWKTKKAQEFRDAPEHVGKIVILEKHFARARAIVDAGKQALTLSDWDGTFVDGAGNGEVMIAWSEDGFWLRTLIDWLDRGIVTDYKTTGMSIAPHVVGPMIERMGWDVQAAMHERALLSVNPNVRPVIRFVAQENYPPYSMLLVELDNHWLTMGRKKLERAISIWRECITTDQWPGYPLKPFTPEYPKYKEASWLEREEMETRPGRSKMLTDLAGG